MLLVTQQPLLGGVGLEAVHQFVWAARGCTPPSISSSHLQS
jgi:hypothetical protein